MRNDLRFSYKHTALPPVDGTMRVNARVELSEDMELDLHSFHEEGMQDWVKQQLVQRLRNRLDRLIQNMG